MRTVSRCKLNTREVSRTLIPSTITPRRSRRDTHPPGTSIPPSISSTSNRPKSASRSARVVHFNSAAYKPVLDWSDSRAVRTGREERHPQANRVPVLGPQDLARLGYDDQPVPPGTLRSSAHQTRKRLKGMEEMGGGGIGRGWQWGARLGGVPRGTDRQGLIPHGEWATAQLVDCERIAG